MKKKLLIVFSLIGSSILIVVLVWDFGLWTPEKIFENNVLTPVPASIENVNCAKDFGRMHGPIACSFEAPASVVHEITAHNGMVQVTVFQEPQLVESSAESFDKYSWWNAFENLNSMQKYEAFEEGNSGENDLREYKRLSGKYLFHDNNGTIYFLKY